MTRGSQGGGCGCLVLVLFFGGLIIYESCEDRANRRRIEAERKAEAELADFEQTPPVSGSCRIHKQSYFSSPFQICSQGGADYLVKLVDVRSGAVACDVFVQGGTTVTVNVPDGTYEMRYASGYVWYGYDRLFGPRTNYSKADRKFTFSAGNGYTVTLYKTPGGNLKTSEIDARHF